MPRKNDNTTKLYLIKNISDVVAHSVKWTGIVLVTYYIYKMFEVLAGKSTFANIIVAIMADYKNEEWKSWALLLMFIFALGCLIYGLNQRRLRKREIEKNSAYRAELEKLLNPKRESSKLTTRGNTNPKDK